MLHVRQLLVLLVSFSLVGCDLLNDTTPKPWIGYAWNKEQKRVEWFFNGFETWDREEAMLHAIETSPDNQWYSNRSVVATTETTTGVWL